jgi:hypothetical protein
MVASRLKDLDELLHGIFVTAMEGGVNYWASVERYRWSIGDGEIEDEQGFEAELLDRAELEDTGKRNLLRVDREVILRGLQRLADGSCTWGGRELSPEWRARAAGWLAAPTSADVDASDADNVVQSGLFGDIVYG